MPEFRFLDKADFDNMSESLFSILTANMSRIAPTGRSYEEDYNSWYVAVKEGLAQDERRIILIFSNKRLVGFFQYYTSGVKFMMEEIQIRTQWQGRDVFRALYRFLIPLLPSELRDVEAYAHKNNEKSHGILRRLGLVVVGENKRGDSYHFRGQYADLLRWHFQDSGEEGAICKMQIWRISQFLETDRLCFTFTPHGLKYLALQGNGGEQAVDLRENNPGAAQSPQKRLLLKETVKFIETGRHDLTLDLTELTDFQKAVFDQVRKITPGEIVTYGAVADRIGKPRAARAVGRAISKNPVSYFIPTHRVLPRRGLGRCISGAGYLRQKLLVHEGHDLLTLAGRR